MVEFISSDPRKIQFKNLRINHAFLDDNGDLGIKLCSCNGSSCDFCKTGGKNCLFLRVENLMAGYEAKMDIEAFVTPIKVKIIIIPCEPEANT